MSWFPRLTLCPPLRFLQRWDRFTHLAWLEMSLTWSIGHTTLPSTIIVKLLDQRIQSLEFSENVNSVYNNQFKKIDQTSLGCTTSDLLVPHQIISLIPLQLNASCFNHLEFKRQVICIHQLSTENRAKSIIQFFLVFPHRQPNAFQSQWNWWWQFSTFLICGVHCDFLQLQSL